MKKVLLINASPHENGCTFTALDKIRAELAKRGAESDLFWLGIRPIADCVACRQCKETGRCALSYRDPVNETIDRLDEYDAIVAGSPVYYSGPSGQACAFLDRLFFSAGGRMAGKIGASVVSCRRGGGTAAFERLNQYFLMNNMVVAGSQYWNVVHGNTPDEVRQDAEGLQVMRSLAANIAWLMKCLDAARQAGIESPQYEPRLRTNFIR